MATKPAIPEPTWKASDLRRLPAKERGDILATAAAVAEGAYRGQPHLTDFEAFGKDDLHGEGTAVPAG